MLASLTSANSFFATNEEDQIVSDITNCPLEDKMVLLMNLCPKPQPALIVPLVKRPL